MGARRRRCAVPATERHRPKWQLAVEMLDELTAWGLRAPVVVADAGYGDNAHLRAAPAERGLSCVVQVEGAVIAHGVHEVPETIPYRSRGRPSTPRRYAPGRSVCEIMRRPPAATRR
ncbi:transposase [Streptosporangium sandarakinum]